MRRSVEHCRALKRFEELPQSEDEWINIEWVDQFVFVGLFLRLLRPRTFSMVFGVGPATLKCGGRLKEFKFLGWQRYAGSWLYPKALNAATRLDRAYSS